MSVTVDKLESGIRVATDVMADAGSIALGLWVGAGGRHERPEQNGIAHFLEHMAFKGTLKRSAYDLAAEIEAVGGDLNAYTSREATAYHLRVLPEDLPLALDILADIVQHPAFEATELERERQVILQEIGQAHDTPDDIIFDHFQEAAFRDQALGRPILGRPEVVRAMDRQALIDFRATHYAPERMVLSAAGAVDHDRFLRLAGDLFTDLPASVPAETDEAAQYSGGEFMERRDLEQVHLLLGFPGVAHGRGDYYTMAVLTMLLGGGMSSRLFQEVREKRGLAYNVHAFHSAYSDSGLFGIYAGTEDKDAEEAIAVSIGELGKVAGEVGAEELVRAKAQLRASLLMNRETSGYRAEALAKQLLIYGRALPLTEILERLESVDETAVSTLAARLLRGAPTLAAMGPLPRRLPDVAGLIDRAA